MFNKPKRDQLNPKTILRKAKDKNVPNLVVLPHYKYGPQVLTLEQLRGMLSIEKAEEIIKSYKDAYPELENFINAARSV